MSLHERNKMLEILHAQGVNRDNINRIMTDLDGDGFFEEPDEESCDDWDLIEDKAAVWFSEKEPLEKLELIKEIDEKGAEEQKRQKANQHIVNTEKRIRQKQRDLIVKGIVSEDPFEEGLDEEPVEIIEITRYGRTPLHEAIAMRDISKVKKYIKITKYLSILDNNGHTPYEMAIYEDFREAVMLFKSTMKKKGFSPVTR